MSAIGRIRRVRPVLLTAASVATLAGAWLALLPAEAIAGTGVTITSGACAGGGSAFCFSPEGAAAVAGSVFTWTNTSGSGHTATLCTPSACPGAPANTGADTFNVTLGAANGSSGSFRFTNPGTYHYYCTIHGYALMHGSISVTAAPTSPSPSASATNPSSRATLSGGAPVTPATGSAPSPAAGMLLAIGTAFLLGAVRARRR